MCRSRDAGGRRCPGCAGTAARDAHNARRRHNRKLRRQIREFIRYHHLPEAIADSLERRPIPEVKGWALEHGVAAADMELGANVSRLRMRASWHSQEGLSDLSSSSAHPSSSLASAGSGRWGDKWSEAGGAVLASIAKLQEDQGTRPGEASLLDKEVAAVRPVAGGTNITNIVELVDGTNGYHKPFSGLRIELAQSFGQDGPLQSIHEVAAYRFAHELGEPYRSMVPPTVLREVAGELGSLQADAAGGNPPPDVKELSGWRDAAFYDALIGQQDRHHGNYRASEAGHIRLIDHGYSFSRDHDYENASNFKHVRAMDEPALTEAELQICQRVINSPDTLGMRGVLEPARVQAIRDRAQRMLDTKEIEGAQRARELKRIVEEHRRRAREADRRWAERNKRGDAR